MGGRRDKERGTNIQAAPGLKKTSVAGTIAWATLARTWTVKTTWNHSIKLDGLGSETVASDIYSLGVTRVFY